MASPNEGEAAVCAFKPGKLWPVSLEEQRQEQQPRAAVILVAAGMGTRLGAGIPKAMVQLAGTTLAEHALDRMLQLEQIHEVIVVTPPEDHRLAALLQARGQAAVRTVPGGASRAASVRKGLDAVSSSSSLVLVHDAARALAPAELFDRVLKALAAPSVDAVIPALPVTDTISVIEQQPGTGHGVVRSTPDRSTLRAVQTPQGFAASVLRAAHQRLDGLDDAGLEQVTDDASIVRALGVEVHVVDGSPQALKITHAQDLDTAQQYLQGAAMNLPRIGNGVDIHAVSEDPSREMWLAGLHFPEDTGLSGHSDGDAVAHAACDALFSAAGVGDLGTHFGVDRPEYSGASGVTLLAEAGRIVREAGFEIGNVAVQFVGRRPRFAARREEANQVLSAALGAPVSVSATTSDGLGYEGAGAGVTAYATALLVQRQN